MVSFLIDPKRRQGDCGTPIYPSVSSDLGRLRGRVNGFGHETRGYHALAEADELRCAIRFGACEPNFSALSRRLASPESSAYSDAGWGDKAVPLVASQRKIERYRGGDP